MSKAQPPYNSNDTIDLSHQLQPHYHGLSSAQAATLYRQRPGRLAKRIAAFVRICLWQILRPLRLLSILYLLALLLYSSAWQDGALSFSLALVISLIFALISLRAAFFFRLFRRLQAQQNEAMPNCRVVRDGIVRACRPEELVPDDLIELSVGTIIPAEALVVEQDALAVAELKGNDWQLVTDQALGLGLVRLAAGNLVMQGRGRALLETYPDELPAARLIKTSDQAWFREPKKLPRWLAWLRRKQDVFERSPFWWVLAMLPPSIHRLYAGAIEAMLFIMLFISIFAISLHLVSVLLWCGFFLACLLEQFFALLNRPDPQSQDAERAQAVIFILPLVMIYVVWMFVQEGMIFSLPNYAEIRAALGGLLLVTAGVWLFDHHQERELGQAAVYIQLLELAKSGMLARNPAMFAWLEGANCLLLDLDQYKLEKLKLERAIYSGGVLAFDQNQTLPKDPALESLIRSAAICSISFVDMLTQTERDSSAMLGHAVQPALQQLGIERATIGQRYSYLNENRELSFPDRELLLSDTDNPKRVMELICGDYERVIRYCDTIVEGTSRRALSSERRKALEDALAAAYAEGLVVIAFAYRLHGGSSQTINLKEATRFVGMLCFKAHASEDARRSLETLRANKLELVWTSQQPLQIARAMAHALGVATRNFQLFDADALQGAGHSRLQSRINSLYVGMSSAQKRQILRGFRPQERTVFALWNELSDLWMLRDAELSIVLASQEKPSLQACADLAIRSPRINSLLTLFTARDRLRLNLVKRLQFWLIAGLIQIIVCFVALITWSSSLGLVQMAILSAPILLVLTGLHSLLSWALINEPDEVTARQELSVQLKKPLLFGLAPLNLICSGILSWIMPFFLLSQIHTWGATREQQMVLFGFVMILLQVFTALTIRRSFQPFYTALLRNKTMLMTLVIVVVCVALFVLTPLQTLFLGEILLNQSRFGLLLMATSSVLWQGEL
jgi:magnesium-transporting ATPase (P-type)